MKSSFKMKHEESNLQQACVKWFRYQYPNIIIFAIPNGGNRNVIEAARLKREGVLAGVADLMILKPNNKYYGLFVEMKTDKGKQSDNQIDFEMYCVHHHYKYSIARSLDEFISIVENYFKS